MDDNFMSAVLEDKACCELVLSIILNRDDIEVIECKTQYSVTNLHGRAVRLDVLAKDKTGAYLNIEVQRNDRDAAPKRARFNSSLLDANVVEKGTEFKDFLLFSLPKMTFWGEVCRCTRLTELSGKRTKYLTIIRI